MLKSYSSAATTCIVKLLESLGRVAPEEKFRGLFGSTGNVHLAYRESSMSRSFLFLRNRALVMEKSVIKAISMRSELLVLMET